MDHYNILNIIGDYRKINAHRNDCFNASKEFSFIYSLMIDDSMEMEGIVKSIDTLIRGLTHPNAEIDSSDIKSVREDVDEEDKPKLASKLEDLLVLLKDDPENKAKIKIICNQLMEGYGHIKPISELLKSIKSTF